ncbi:RDD family protein [Salinispirillum sp. LH 10-3-1]|uniref:RDD family protein n=1 Tax=Salinispirillum sp. LH 10-3-1 TaxID=2952525 RepID=A0AB38YF85_9GAMM
MTSQSVDTPTQYASFGARLWASILDGILFFLISFPLLMMIYGKDYWIDERSVYGFADILINWVFPFVAIMLFWVKKQATPGKMAVSARIVCARTGGRPTVQQFVIRYVGYIVSAIPLLLGYFWMLWDDRNQTWHDKMSGTVVVRDSH